MAYGGTLPLGNQSWQNVSLLDEPGAGSYPLTTFTYAIVYADLGHAYDGTLSQNAAAWLASFLYWMSVAEQPYGYGTSLGYPPLPPHVTTSNVQIVELLMYDGIPALGDVDYDGD
jgi:phosphate transport system substrate-binding protein